MAFLMLSAGIETAFAATIAVRRRGLPSGSPPLRAAIVISLIRRVNSFPRLASRAAFLCLMVAHLECPDMTKLRSVDGRTTSVLVLISQDNREQGRYRHAPRFTHGR